MPKINNFRVVLEQDEKGYFVASVPAIPGCYTQGDTYEEAIKNIKEAIELCLEEAQENQNFHSKIDFNNSRDSRFIGITEVTI